MDTTKKMPCPKCDNPDMDGWGASIGGRVMSWKKKCSECGCVLLIVPMKKEYTYTISAQTDEEQEADSKKRRKIAELEKEADDIRRTLQ